MASLLADADAVKSAVSSVSTCSATTIVILKGLLLSRDEAHSGNAPTADSRKTTRPTKAPTTGRARAPTKTKPAEDASKDELSAREKAALATQVVNAALKALAEAAKPVPQTPSKRPDDGVLVKAATRNALRRSNSMPMTPLQPRSLNRVSTSPIKTARSFSAGSNNSMACLSTVECARIAFSALRTLQSSCKVTLPELQLEGGISSFAGRLINLALYEQAVKELRILKTMLERRAGVETKSQNKAPATEQKTSPYALAELLDFGGVKSSDPAISLIVTTQIQALRILSAMKKPALVEAALPILRKTHPSCVVNHILSMTSQPNSDTAKLARQMETVSQSLLSLTPNVSSKDDGIAADSRLNISPAAALELQGLGLESRLLWWKIAGHRGDIEKDILSPLSRCLGSFVRRTKTRSSAYTLCANTFHNVQGLLRSQPQQSSTSSKSPLLTIYQLLATLARESGKLEDAVKWARSLRDASNPETESAAKICSIAAQLLAFQLKLDPVEHLRDTSLLTEVSTGVHGSLRGDITELDELLGNVSILRRAIIAILLGHIKDGKGATIQAPQNAREPLETFILQCPRFCLRWLGKAPTPTSSTKDYLRYEQRRQLLLQSIHHTLDSAFVLAKTVLDEQRLEWDVLEAMLGDCLSLLESMGEIPMTEDAASYYVKISHFYYMKYSSLRQQSGDSGNASALRALRRSIDCVKYRPSKEREKAQLLFKLERMAELCKSLGRRDEALGALQGIRNSLVDDGVLGAVASALETHHPQVAWSLNRDVNVLCRTLSSIARMEMVWMDWTVDFAEAEQAAALEHRLHFVLLGGETKIQPLTLDNSTVDALLRIYIPTRFPVRRLRTLLRLLCATLGDVDLLTKVRAITADAVQLGEDDLGEDAHLAHYLPHMKAMFASVTGLADGYLDTQSLQQTLAVWRAMVDANSTSNQLESCIDGIADLLAHLDSVADFLRLKGAHDLLNTVVHLSADIARITEGPRPEYFINTHTALALHLTDSGSSAQAAQIFDMAVAFLGKCDDAPGYVAAELQLAFADYLLTIGNAGKAHDHLAKAATSFASNHSAHKIPPSRKKVLFAYATYLRSLIALEHGNSHHALAYCRDSVRILFQEWTRLESRLADKKDRKSTTSDESMTDLTMSTGARDSPLPVAAGPDFWIAFRQLFRTILQLSATYSHLGMFQETVYYADQAEKMARTTQSDFHIAQATTWLASVYLKAAQPGKSLEFMQQARDALKTDYQSCSSLKLVCQMGTVYRGLLEHGAEMEMAARAEKILAALSPEAVANPGEPNTAELENKMAKLDIKEKPVARTTRRRTRAQPAKRMTSTAVVKLKVIVTTQPIPLPIEDAYIATVRAAVLINKAVSLLGRKDWSGAAAILRDAAATPTHSSGWENKHVTLAACLIGQSLEGMAHDSVFSVVHDSTLSFPTVAGLAHDRSSADRLSLTKQSPPRKGRGTTAANRKEPPKEPVSQAFLVSLLEAQDTLLEAHAEVALTGDSSLLHRISAMLQTVTLVLSTISVKSRTVSHIGHAASSIDLARNLTWRRERKVVLQEKHTPKADGSEWPAILSSPEESKRTSLGLTDFNKFQRDYIEILPKTWAAISIGLSENKHDLCITKLQAGQSPFVIRLPLERASSRDADTEVFNFQQGRAELLEIIGLANETCHDARDMTVKGAKAAWWADREALDNRMRELLENMERDWLGGFRGIFSQHQRRPDLLARFQKSFQNVLDKHLPSRRQVRGKKTKAAAATATSKITLDPRILELFIGLGDATVEDCDFDDALTDLLYFVVDILQFHGERNAYDEVDFDAMVVETFDALHAYHSAAKADAAHQAVGRDIHTILVLDKALHAFPWESLPCMQGQAISRVPSLACLRRLILEAQPPSTSTNSLPSPNTPAGHHIPLTSGTYILNPSSDLKSTLTTFSAPLKTHLPSPTWTSIVSRPPTEEEFSHALSASPLLLYFGHGSGAQYIRGRTVRRLEPGCKAVSLLWGCSSAGLVDGGEFEVHGPVWNYLMAGCPAVVGTLWDVTDRDIDRFAARTLEEWGVVGRGTIAVEESRRKGRDKATAGRGGHKAATMTRPGWRDGGRSLVEAVSCAREEACRFRFLTAAAVVVYGIPVYVDK